MFKSAYALVCVGPILPITAKWLIRPLNHGFTFHWNGFRFHSSIEAVCRLSRHTFATTFGSPHRPHISLLSPLSGSWNVFLIWKHLFSNSFIVFLPNCTEIRKNTRTKKTPKVRQFRHQHRQQRPTMDWKRKLLKKLWKKKLPYWIS